MPKRLLNRARTVPDCLKDGPGRYAFGASLYLAVRGRSAIWEYQFRAGGKLKSLCLGSAVARERGDAPVTLTAAREARAAAWLARKNGETATHVPGAPEAPHAAGKRFSQAAADYLRDHKSEWAPKQFRDHERRLRLHAAVLNSKYVARIGVEDVAAVLRPIWTGPNHGRGSKLRGLIETILNAQETLQQPTVAAWSRLQHKLSKEDAETINRAALDYPKLPALMRELAADDSTAARAIRFAILTGSRQMEAIAAKWSEIDLEARVWEVPKDRMKVKAARHFVPLSDAAIACLGEPGAPEDFVFPADRRDGHLGHAATGPKLAEFKRTNEDGQPVTLHGMRSTFATWAEDRGFADKVIDLALAHKERDQVKAAYLRSEMHEPRRKLLEAWGEFATGS